jgi:organic radical activating enzyme
MYQVKEIFYTLQGEGVNAGRPAVFCRFAGCNLWSGREEDRAAAVQVLRHGLRRHRRHERRQIRDGGCAR